MLTHLEKDGEKNNSETKTIKIQIKCLLVISWHYLITKPCYTYGNSLINKYTVEFISNALMITTVVATILANILFCVIRSLNDECTDHKMCHA